MTSESCMMISSYISEEISDVRKYHAMSENCDFDCNARALLRQMAKDELSHAKYLTCIINGDEEPIRKLKCELHL